MLPGPFQPTDTSGLHYYQGLIIVEVALTLIVFMVLNMVHYLKWGYDDEQDKEGEKKNDDEEPSDKKWDQKVFNVYFPIIFANHLASISIIIVYIPLIYSAVIAFFHFVAFCVLVIINIFIKDVEPGKGSRTTASRIVWAVMCLFNVMLIIGGLTGVTSVYPS